MKYDDSEYFFLNFETDLDNDAAATHIGIYLTWIILHEMIAEWHRAEDGDALQALRERTDTPGNVVLDMLDGQLHDADINELGNRFTQWYYVAHYYNDYAAEFGVDQDSNDNFCSVPDTWSNFDRMAVRIDERFENWLKSQ